MRYTFTRRVVGDQRIYVDASSLKEAWAKARAGNVYDTGDQAEVKVTVRRILGEDEA